MSSTYPYVTATISETEYCGELATSNLMVTFAFAAMSCMTFIPFLLWEGSTLHGQEGGLLICFVFLLLVSVGTLVPYVP